MNATQIGARVKRVRRAAGLTQATLASSVPHWVQQTVVKVESGERLLRFSEALVIAAACGVTIDALTESDADIPQDSVEYARSIRETTEALDMLVERCLELRERLTGGPPLKMLSPDEWANPPGSTRRSRHHALQKAIEEESQA